MEKTLLQLFDYQKFTGNASLQGVIDSVHARYTTRKLTLEEASWVNAAGAATADPRKSDSDLD